jgi:carbon storage regulator CsrA
MLVVTRRVNEKIVFPSIGITIQLLKVSGLTARVGIDAPPQIKVLREEVAPNGKHQDVPRQHDHARANALSKVTLGIHLARKQWEAGHAEEAGRTLDQALENLLKFENLLKHDPPAQSGPAPLPKCRALIVEDDDNERELLAGILGMNGCECVTAVDGEDALAYLQTGARPDVVLLDMALPRCGGAETLRRIRTDRNLTGLRVFSVSSTSPRELNIPDGPDGFDAWFPKPLNPQRLWNAILAATQASAN